MNLIQTILNLWPPFSVGAADVSAPEVHYHALVGPSKRERDMVAASGRSYELIGTSTERHELVNHE